MASLKRRWLYILPVVVALWIIIKVVNGGCIGEWCVQNEDSTWNIPIKVVDSNKDTSESAYIRTTELTFMYNNTKYHTYKIIPTTRPVHLGLITSRRKEEQKIIPTTRPVHLGLVTSRRKEEHKILPTTRPVHLGLVTSRRKEEQKPLFEQFDLFETLAATKYKQFKEFTRLYPTFKFISHFPSPRKRNKAARQAFADLYRYRTVATLRQGFINVYITETFNRTTTKGGSSLFATVQSSQIISMCAYFDHADGSYTVQCPTYEAPSCRIKIMVLDVDHHQFKTVMRGLDIVLVDKDFATKELEKIPQDKGYWSKDNGKWIWNKGRRRSNGSSADMCNAIKKLDRLYMVGASHMRYQYAFLQHECGHVVPAIWRRLVFVDIKFGNDLTAFLRDLSNASLAVECQRGGTEFRTNIHDAAAMKSILGQTASRDFRIQVFTKRQTIHKNYNISYSQPFKMCKARENLRVGVMLQVGSWDLSTYSLKTILTKTIPAIDQAFKQVHPSKFFKILVTGPPPINSYGLGTGRSNDDIAIFDNHLQKAAAKHKLPFFSMFQMMLLRYRENIQGNSHYLMCSLRKGSRCSGTLGKIAMQEAFLALADQFPEQ